MKKTEYFTGDHYQFHDVEKSIQAAIKKRNEFISKNQIGNIDFEDIKVISNPGNSSVFALIQLTYFPEEK